jgi:hypothetical protein
MSLDDQEREPKCDITTVCVLRREHAGPCMRPGYVKVATTRDGNNDEWPHGSHGPTFDRLLGER